MHLILLGTVQVNWEENTPPRFRSQRTVALLGYLVAEQRAFTRDHMAALFWPDEDPSKGKANLRRELHNLAQILPGCWQTSRVEVEFVAGEDVLMEFYGVSGRVTEGYEAINFATEQVKTRLTSSANIPSADRHFWADLLFYYGLHSFLVAKFEQAIECYQECLDTLRHPDLAHLDTDAQEARILRWLGQLIVTTDPAQAKGLYEQSLPLYKKVDEQPMVSGVSNLLADTLRNLGDVQGGYHLLLESLAAAEATGDQRTLICTLELLGSFQLHLDFLAEAEKVITTVWLFAKK